MLLRLSRGVGNLIFIVNWYEDDLLIENIIRKKMSVPHAHKRMCHCCYTKSKLKARLHSSLLRDTNEIPILFAIEIKGRLKLQR